MKANLRQLEAFVLAYRLGSLTRAAEQMFLTQAAVSTLIKRLEETLDVRLFERTTRRLRPTAAAREVLPIAESVLRDMTRLESSARELASRSRGTIAFAATPAIAASAVTAVMRAFADEFPELKMRLYDTPVDRLLTLVESGDVDFAVGTPTLGQADVTTSVIATDEISVICDPASALATLGRRGKPIAWSELGRHVTVSMERSSGIGRLMNERLALAKCKFAPTYEVGFLATALAMTQARLAAAVLPSAYLLGQPRLLGLVAFPIAKPVVKREILVITRRGHVLSPAADAFVQRLKTTFSTSLEASGTR